MIQTTWRDIAHISGVGDDPDTGLAGALGNRGYRYVEDLLSADPMVIAADMVDIRGISAQRYRTEFFPQARLSRLPHMTESIANRLVCYGVTYHHLAYLPLNEIRSYLREVDLSDDTLLMWQGDSAKRMISRSLTLDLVDGRGNPVRYVVVYVTNAENFEFAHNRAYEPNQYGRVLIEHILSPQIGLTVDTKAYNSENYGTVGQITLSLPYDNRRIVVDKPLDDEGAVYNESVYGVTQIQRPEYNNKRTDRLLAAITEFYITGMTADEVRLSLPYRVLIDGTWKRRYMLVPVRDITGQVALRQMVARTGTSFTVLDATFEGVDR